MLGHPMNKLHEEQIVIDLILKYAESVIPKGDRLHVDPMPTGSSAWEQYHLWYFQPNLLFEMAGFFRVKGRHVLITEIIKMPFDEIRFNSTQATKEHSFDIADPDAAQMERLFRRMFARTRRHLKAEFMKHPRSEAASGKR